MGSISIEDQISEGIDVLSGQTPFTIHNLPYGVISTSSDSTRRCATVFQDTAVDLSALYDRGLFRNIPGLDKNVFAHVSITKLL